MRRGWTNSVMISLFAVTIIAILSSCRGHQSPKPRGYFRIEFPEHSYQLFDSTYPYKFEYPEYAKIVADTLPDAEAYWCNVSFPTLNGQIHLSYKTVGDRFYDLLEDSRKLAYKHSIKADAINERYFENPDKQVMGVLYEIKGNAASPFQFFVTDSTKHFLRGSLYFNTVPNKDSLAPVIQFVKEDIEHLIESIEWK
nr:gliding motility lipoprotein GldD [uncultured Carboxylicivirga sp.]